MLSQKRFEKQNEKKETLKSDHIKTGRLIFNRYQSASFYFVKIFMELIPQLWRECLQLRLVQVLFLKKFSSTA